MRLLLAAALVLLAVPAFAKDGVPQGIAFAQTGDRTWLCRHEDAHEALSCARERCTEETTGQNQACVVTTWCFPAQWSGEMTVWVGETQSTRILCGMASETALSEVLGALCGTIADAEHCDLTLTIDPDGNERKVDGVSFAGGAAPPPLLPPLEEEDSEPNPDVAVPGVSEAPASGGVAPAESPAP